MYVIRGSIKTDYKRGKKRKSKIGIEKLYIGKIQNRKISNFGPNHGANERPKGEQVAVGDLKGEFLYSQFQNAPKVSKDTQGTQSGCKKSFPKAFFHR